MKTNIWSLNFHLTCLLLACVYFIALQFNGEYNWTCIVISKRSCLKLLRKIKDKRQTAKITYLTDLRLWRNCKNLTLLKLTLTTSANKLIMMMNGVDDCFAWKLTSGELLRQSVSPTYGCPSLKINEQVSIKLAVCVMAREMSLNGRREKQSRDKTKTRTDLLRR